MRLYQLNLSPLSIRRQFLILISRTPEKLYKAGTTQTLKSISAAVHRYQETGSLIIPQINQPYRRPYEYADWIANHESPEFITDIQKREAATFSYQPQFSIITPVFNPPPSIYYKVQSDLFLHKHTRIGNCVLPMLAMMKQSVTI